MATRISRQWISVIAIVAGLAGGAWALTRFGNQVRPVEVGNDAPNFSAVNLKTGDTISLDRTYRDKVVLVNLWATWCPPCRQEMPAMETLYRELGPKGFRIAAVSVDEGNLKDVVAFADELSLTFDILHDGDGSVQKTYQTIMFPESFLIDRHGVIVKKVIGEHPWSSDANRQLIARLLDVELDAPAPAAATPTPGG